MTGRPCSRLFISRSLSAINSSRFDIYTAVTQFGINKFLWRSLFLRGEYFVTDYLQNLTWWLAALSFSFRCSVLRVEVLNQLNIYLFLVDHSALDWVFGSGFTISFRSLYSICLCNRWFESAMLIFTAHLTSLCLGAGKNKTIESSIIQRVLFHNY